MQKSIIDSNRVFAGVDLSTGKRGLTVALLSSRLDVRSLKLRTLDEAAEELSSWAEITVALCGPLRPWQAEAAGESSAGEDPHAGRRKPIRAADAELARRGIPVRRTSAPESAAPAWMRSGFTLARDLTDRGFLEGRQVRESLRVLIETNPAACSAVLLGRLPFGRGTLEGRIQRQLVLLREKVALPDPMDALEELTAHHLLSGQLGLNGILKTEDLDALLAAYTAWRAFTSPDAVSWLGCDAEGWLCLPVKDLLEKYSK